MKRLAVVILVVLAVASLAVAGGKQEAAGGGKAVAEGGAAPRPGMVKPNKQYFIALSNGAMTGSWRTQFVKDLVEWGELYQKTYGIKFVWTNANDDSATQLTQVQGLISQKPDVLIVSPNEVAPLAPIYDMCNQMKVPLICIDRGLEYDPRTPNDMYVQVLSYDYVDQGVQQGIAIVKYLQGKYGKPAGSVVEIPGRLGAYGADHFSMGMKMVLEKFPDVKIIDMRPGDYDRQVSMRAMEDLLSKWPKGKIDVVVTGCDDGALGILDAIKAANRTEILPGIIGRDAVTDFLAAMLNGEGYFSIRSVPFYGRDTFAQAVKFLNGEKIPAYYALPSMPYLLDTEEQKQMLADDVKYARDNKLFCPPIWLDDRGMTEKFKPEIAKYYPTAWWDNPDVLKKYPPFVAPWSAADLK